MELSLRRTKTNPSYLSALRFAKLGLAKKAYDIKVYNVKKQCDMADYIVVMSASSNRQVHAIADAVLNESHFASVEGLPQAHWALVDTGDVIVHIFLENVRDYYHFDKLYGHFECETVQETQRKILRLA